MENNEIRATDNLNRPGKTALNFIDVLSVTTSELKPWCIQDFRKGYLINCRGIPVIYLKLSIE